MYDGVWTLAIGISNFEILYNKTACHLKKTLPSLTFSLYMDMKIKFYMCIFRSMFIINYILHKHEKA